MSHDPRVIDAIAFAIECLPIRSCPAPVAREFAAVIADGTKDFYVGIHAEEVPDPRDESGRTMLPVERVRVLSREDSSPRVNPMNSTQPYPLDRFASDVQYFNPRARWA